MQRLATPGSPAQRRWLTGTVALAFRLRGIGAALDVRRVGIGVALNAGRVGVGVALNAGRAGVGVALNTGSVGIGVALNAGSVGIGVALNARLVGFGVVLAASLLASGIAQGASFDCERARGKLMRNICSDATLSQLDEQVWNAYGERIKTLSSAQYTQVRDRHITWRRERGLYDAGVPALTDDYRRHLAWLSHPLLPLEGRYARSDGAEISVELDLHPGKPATALNVIGRQGSLQWLPPRAGLPPNAIEPDLGPAEPRAAVALTDGVLRLRPNFIGTPRGLLKDCELTLRWLEDTLRLDSQGKCGAELDGAYQRMPPEHPWPRWRPTPAGSVMDAPPDRNPQ